MLIVLCGIDDDLVVPRVEAWSVVLRPVLEVHLQRSLCTVSVVSVVGVVSVVSVVSDTAVHGGG